MKLVSTSIEIKAPAERVWQILTDFDAYPDWNPFIRSISGQPRAGEKLEIYVSPPGGKGMTFKPVVLAARVNREFRWKGKLLLPNLFDGEHFFTLEPTATGTCLHHGEKFNGILTAVMSAASYAKIERGFIEMNEAIKRRAEA